MSNFRLFDRRPGSASLAESLPAGRDIKLGVGMVGMGSSRSARRFELAASNWLTARWRSRVPPVDRSCVVRARRNRSAFGRGRKLVRPIVELYDLE